MPDMCPCFPVWCDVGICTPWDYGIVYAPSGCQGVKAYYRCVCGHRWTCYWSLDHLNPGEITDNHARPPTRELDKHGTLSFSATKRQVEALPERSRRSTGFVYVAKCGKYHKIGYSKTPERRVESLQTGNPEPVVLVGTIEGTKDTELQLHQQFHAKRVRGEWFELTDEDVQWLLKPTSAAAAANPSAPAGTRFTASSARRHRKGRGSL